MKFNFYEWLSRAVVVTEAGTGFPFTICHKLLYSSHTKGLVVRATGVFSLRHISAA